MIEFDNAANLAFTQNPASDDAQTLPEKFSRVVWTEPDAEGAFFYCTTDFGAESVEELKASPTDGGSDQTPPRGAAATSLGPS